MNQTPVESISQFNVSDACIEKTWTISFIVVIVPIQLLLLLFGCAFNGLIVSLPFRYEDLRATSRNIYLASASLASMLYLLIFVPLHCLSVGFRGDWAKLTQAACNLNGYANMSLVSIIVLQQTIANGDTYVRIVFPFRQGEKPKLTIGLVAFCWLYGAILGIAPFAEKSGYSPIETRLICLSHAPGDFSLPSTILFNGTLLLCLVAMLVFRIHIFVISSQLRRRRKKRKQANIERTRFQKKWNALLGNMRLAACSFRCFITVAVIVILQPLAQAMISLDSCSDFRLRLIINSTQIAITVVAIAFMGGLLLQGNVQMKDHFAQVLRSLRPHENKNFSIPLQSMQRSSDHA